MAPIRTSASSTLPRKSILKSSSRPRQIEPEPLFPSSKKDKRKIKHEQLMSKVAKSASSKPRRRRPNKKLVTTLDALADALPRSDDDTAAQLSASGHRLHSQINVIQRKSMRSKPGAMKRREKIDKGERDRFAKNLAQMSVNSDHSAISTGSASQPQESADRWKALRGFIAQTMEKKPELIT